MEMKTNKKIAIIAHDGMKSEMVKFVKEHQKVLQTIPLVATGTTGSLIEKEGLKVEKKKPGPMGGDIQIASMVVENQILMVFFFLDVQNKHPHEPDIQAFLRLCNLYNIPLATNSATASLLIKSLAN